VEGQCVDAFRAETTPCDGGSCNAAGTCVLDSCSTDEKDGDETDVDCGGPCGPCEDDQGCSSGDDCLSGVCTNKACKASACTDGIKNGSETDVDCGGTCAANCALTKGCNIVSDCAKPLLPDNVRCLENVCTSTAPVAGYRYWQDFHPTRRVTASDQCSAADDVCLHGATSGYPMHGIDSAGVKSALTTDFLATAGVVGRAGNFDGNFCLVRGATDLSLRNESALTVMTWVYDQKTVEPWQSGLVNGSRYGLAIDSMADTRRFLASLKTETTTLPYQSSTATGQVPRLAWHHVAAVYDNSSGAMIQYLDGAPVHSTAVTGSFTADSFAVYVGCAGLRKQMFKGLLDEIVIYPTALSAEQIADYVRRTRP
jgi:hypothetical protein